MNKLYLLGVFCVVLGAAYWAGGRAMRHGSEINTAQGVVQQQSEIFNIQEKVNEEVIHCGTDDVRRILRQRYTIAE